MPTQKTTPTKSSRGSKAKPRKRVSRDKSDTGLNAEMQAFVDELLTMRRMNATEAYMRVYRVAKPEVAAACASRLLRLAKVKKALVAGMEARAKRVEYTQDQMFNELVMMMQADVNQLIEHQRVCCRHCWGKDFLYQWTDREEYERTCKEVEEATPEGEVPDYPLDDGGYGFDSSEVPHPKCPKCKGLGYGNVVMHDTRFLKGGERMLYGGVEVKESGIKMVIHDQLAVRKLLMQHLGMLDPKLNLGDKENPLLAIIMQMQGRTHGPDDPDEPGEDG